MPDILFVYKYGYIRSDTVPKNKYGNIRHNNFEKNLAMLDMVILKKFGYVRHTIFEQIWLCWIYSC